MAEQFLVGVEADRRGVNPARETIFALSSGAVPAAIAIVRVSGPAVPAILGTLAAGVPPPRHATLRTIVDMDGGVIDRALALFFPGPGSATGEDVAEFHVHGGRAVVAALLGALGAQPGCRLALPGEFTRRGFEAGKLDLSQVEGIADLIAAETDAQRVAALSQVEGSLGRAIERWRTVLVAALAETEAAIDFSDEDDVARGEEPDDLGLASLGTEIAAALDDADRARQLRDGLTVVVTGPPNVGKSSLVNELARTEVSIVAATPGTTRDAVSVRLDLQGVVVTLIDTAGLRETNDEVEARGIDRARRLMGEADLVLSLYCEGEPPSSGVAVLTKTDLERSSIANSAELAVSSVTGAGIPELLTFLTAWARSATGAGEPPLLMRERQGAACRDALAAILEARQQSELVLRAESLRQALNFIGQVTGGTSPEMVLDALFAQFCIGK